MKTHETESYRLGYENGLQGENFFGPQAYIAEIVEYPPYTTRVNMIRYGYESERVIYDVVIPERPVQGVTRWYKTNGVSSPTPTATHTHIERHFGLGHLPASYGVTCA